MSETPTPETDGLEAHKDEAVCRLVVPSIFSRRLERERDEARMELKRLKKELVSINRGAETNAKINQSLAKKLHDLEGYAARTRDHLQASSTMHRETMNERDEARRERDDSMEELDRMHKKLASLIRRWKGREKEYLNAVTLALEKGDKSASCRYHGQSIGTHWAIEDLELILKRKDEA